MQIILIQSLLFSILIFTVTSLHLQTQPPIYDPNTYLQSLTTTQDKLNSDLQNLQSIYKSLDSSLLQATNDPNQQLRLYQQGIADERDSLYSIQQYLTLPYNQRACQCFNFTDTLRQNLNQQLSNIQQQLNNIIYQSQQCANCSMSTQIQYQIQMQKNYLSIMNDTINSRCCQVYNFIYVDNLTASNWINGGWSPQQYQTWMSQQVQNAISLNPNQTLVRSCPLSTPYASLDLSQCNQCQTQNLLFNIQTRQCQQCPSNKIFNYVTHNCDYNIPCPPGSILNQTTVMCQKIYPPINATWCPSQTPVWNPQLLGCFKCDISTPYYDAYLGSCTACPASTTYNPSTNQCINSNCRTDQIYNPTTQLCQPRPTNPPTPIGSTSQCPADRPYWDRASLSCVVCPLVTPFYNTSSTNCQVCPFNSTYNQTLNKCTVVCPPGQQSDPITLICSNITTVQPGSQNSLCPPDRPIWNPDSKSCSQCSSNMPYWNQNTGLCQICPMNQAWNNATYSCQTQTEQITCSPGAVFNPISGTCDILSDTIAFCPPDKPYYDSQLMGCTQCPSTQPYYNSTTNQCQMSPNPNITIVCLPGFVYDPNMQTCIQPGNITMVSCPPTTPLWNSAIGTCQACPSSTLWNITINACVPCTNPSLCPVTLSQNTTCDYNYQWSNITGSCRKCQPYQKYNTITKQCDSICKIGETYDTTLQICSGTISNCPIGLVYDLNKMLCICSQGVSFKYYPQLNQCQQYCPNNQQYNYLTQLCESIS